MVEDIIPTPIFMYTFGMTRRPLRAAPRYIIQLSPPRKTLNPIPNIQCMEIDFCFCPIDSSPFSADKCLRLSPLYKTRNLFPSHYETINNTCLTGRPILPWPPTTLTTVHPISPPIVKPKPNQTRHPNNPPHARRKLPPHAL